MPTSAIVNAISASINGRRLLEHPYYRAWQEGELRQSDLQSYAEQYRHFERCLPEVLAGTAARAGSGEARRLIETNLEDELSTPRPHVALFDDFAASVGAVGPADMTRATSDLVGLYSEAAEHGPVASLAVIAAYETQAAEIAATKAAALSLHYGFGPEDTQFWTVHSTLEQDHSAWTVEALEHLGASEDEVALWAGRSARAWWAFLDEREALRAA